ncbi:Brp/Blh family beta-carotene 15,15'-dioxygenase [Aurantiacibacter aquimixticola]|nr:Brp/Blh family beta-carotene 15,15'-dioxygenase [Aurantiacibacter aquimixticola]
MAAAPAANEGRSAHGVRAALPFVVLAVAGVAQLSGTSIAVVLGLIFFLIGTAHGAGDEQDGTIRPFGIWQAAAYIVAGLAVAAVFVMLPLAGLTLFLGLSLWHFARSLHGDWLRGWAYAALVIGGSMALRFEETAAVFAAILGFAPPDIWLYGVATIGLAGLALAAAQLLRQPRDPALIVSALAVAFLHPVLAVGTAFLVGHALPLQAEQAERHGCDAVLRAQWITSALALAGTVALALAWNAGFVPLTVVAALAFGMTVPHMLAERLER